MRDKYSLSRLMYIIEAALEYFISIAVGTVYLAKITVYMGVSDALTGILSAFVSLGCGFQIIAVFFSHKRSVKSFVTAGETVSKLLFSLVYFIPLVDMSKNVKIFLFAVVFLSAQIIHNVINSPKINWFMSLVDDGKRGRFTANKEIVSLLGGMLFSYGLGSVMDYFEARGDMRSAFAVCGVGLIALSLLHTVTFTVSKEKTIDINPISVKESIRALASNKALFKIILVSVFWNIANYATVSFSSTYQVKELGFSATFASLVIMLGSFARVAFSRPMGRFADRTSFCKMLTACFSIELVAFAVNAFACPSNGKWLYTLYYIIHSMGMAGINSAVINLIYDYVGFEQRTGALALQQTFAGVSGFLAVIALSPAVDFIQKSSPVLFGQRIYAQQILSLFSCVFTGVIIVYLNKVIKKIKKQGAEV